MSFPNPSEIGRSQPLLITAFNFYIMNLITFFKTVKCQVLPTLAFVFAIGFNVSAQVSDEGCMDPNACNYDPNATQDVGSCEFFIDCTGKVIK